MTDSSSSASVPSAPLTLGLAGLIPFPVAAVTLLAPTAFGLDRTLVDLVLATYAAVIVSFLGGIRWGLAVRRDGDAVAPWVVSVVPSLVAWAALAAPEPWRLAILGLVALGLGPIDLFLVQSGAAPAWFGRLRLLLSTGAGASLLLAATAIYAAGR